MTTVYLNLNGESPYAKKTHSLGHLGDELLDPSVTLPTSN